MVSLKVSTEVLEVYPNEGGDYACPLCRSVSFRASIMMECHYEGEFLVIDEPDPIGNETFYCCDCGNEVVIL